MTRTSASAYAGVKLPADFRKITQAQHPGVVIQLAGDGLDGQFVTLRLLKIPEEQRNAGLGTAIMSELVAAADRRGWNLALSPSGDFNSSAVRLEVFYRRFGFVNNRGRRRDLTTGETMIRCC